MIHRLGALFTRLSHRLMPHPFVFALILTVVTFLLGWSWGGKPPRELLQAWVDGFWSPPLMVFTLQMALILVTGHALAESRAIRPVLGRLADLTRGTASAVVITSLTAMTAALLNWGLGLIVGALLARTVARRARERGLALHYPLVVAAGYTGLLVWHGGLSGSAPVSLATAGHPLEASTGIIPIRDTLLSPLNFAVTGFLLVAVPCLLALMTPRNPAEFVDPPRPADPAPEPASAEPTWARRLESSRLLVAVVALGGLGFLVPYFVGAGWAGINLNSMIFAFLVVGLLSHGTPLRYARSVDEAAGGAGGILLQFPFYFGIMGMMRGSGLIEKFAELFVSGTSGLASLGIPVGGAYSMLTFLSAGVVNLFVPSGGGQWAVQGPIAVDAAGRLGLELPSVVMALAYGDQLTNMLQPFWALPLLAITRLEARQIVGYTALLMLLVAPALLLLLALLAR